MFGVQDAKIMEMSKTAIRYFAMGIPFYFVNMALINFYQCTKRVRISTVICVLQSFVYTVTFALVLIRPMGSTGVWLSFLLGEIFTLLTAVVYVMYKNKSMKLSFDAVMMFPTNFGGSPEDRLELSIGNSMDEVIKIVYDIGDFTKERGMDKKLSDMISLCVEEMAGNIVQHSFKKGEKRWLDLTVLDKSDTVVVRLRDNGDAFDPLNYVLSEKTDSKIGIRMIYSLASSFEYKRAMGLNNLIIGFKKSL